MNNEKQYLVEIERVLLDLAEEVAGLDEQSPEAVAQLEQVISKALEAEVQKREAYGIGARFSVIATQLRSLKHWYSDSCSVVEEVGLAHEEEQQLAEDELFIYIYLFNANGTKAIYWKPLLSARALIDHSINRPIYAREAYVSELIRSKNTPEQHAYVKAVINKADVLMSESESILQDKLGNPIVRIKHGALKAQSVVEFVHRGKCYQRGVNGDFDLNNGSPLSDV